MAIQLCSWFYHIVGWFHQGLLEEILPNYKTALVRKNIMQFKQEPSELFWRYFERLRTFLSNVLIMELRNGDNAKFFMMI